MNGDGFEDIVSVSDVEGAPFYPSFPYPFDFGGAYSGKAGFVPTWVPQPTGLGNIDRINRLFPTFWENGDGFGRLASKTNTTRNGSRTKRFTSVACWGRASPSSFGAPCPMCGVR